MKNSSFGDLLWRSLLKSWGAFASIASLLLGLVGYFLTPADDQVALRWVIVIITACILVSITTLRAAWSAYSSMNVKLPKVLLVKEPPKFMNNAFALFLVEPTPLLSHGAIVSIYYLDDEMEIFCSVGEVINVQEDGKVQILVHEQPEFGRAAEGIMKNSKDERDKLLVKQTLSRETVGRLGND